MIVDSLRNKTYRYFLSFLPYDSKRERKGERKRIKELKLGIGQKVDSFI